MDGIQRSHASAGTTPADDAPPRTDDRAGEISVLERLGHVLLTARLERGLDRSTLAAQLHMGEEQLHALETADRDRLPESVFVIAQARRVADQLGVDITAQVTALKQTEAALASGAGKGRKNGARPRGSLRAPIGTNDADRSQARRRAAMLLAAALVTAAGCWAWARLQQRGPGTAPASQAAATPGPINKSAATTAGLLLRSTEPSWLEVRLPAGQVLFRGSFQGERRFGISQPLRVLAGRPDLVSVSIAGAAPRPLGRIEEIRWVTLQPPAGGSAGRHPTSATIRP